MPIIRGFGLAVERLTGVCVIEDTKREIQLDRLQRATVLALLDANSALTAEQLTPRVVYFLTQEPPSRVAPWHKERRSARERRPRRNEVYNAMISLNTLLAPDGPKISLPRDRGTHGYFMTRR